MVDFGRSQQSGPIPDTSDDEVKLPLVVFPCTSAPLTDRAIALRRCVARYLPRLGIIMFRGFSTRDHHDFGQFVGALGETPESSASELSVRGQPRTARRTPRLVSSDRQAACDRRVRLWRETEQIGESLQPERWYCRRSPERIWLYCASGGAYVTVADGRDVYAGLPKELCERWSESGLLISRSYPGVGDASWQSAFGSSDRQRVEAWCDVEGFAWEWKSEGRLRIYKVCPPVARHVRTGDDVWRNAAHGVQSPRVRPGGVPAGVEVRSGNGEPLAESDLRVIHAEFDAVKLVVPCEPGDVLLLDNRLMAYTVERGAVHERALYVVREYSDGVEPLETDPVVGG